jgi:hypothetical protein
METLPEPQDPIKSFLSWFMSDEDVARYSDVECALETLKTDEVCWQAAVSIGMHAVVFGHFGETDKEKALVKNLAGYALEPMEALHQSLTQQARQQPLTDEQARMLFHLRFALGFLFQFGKGDPKRALGFLHEMAATQLSRFGGGVGTGGDIVTYTDDMRRGKELAARLMSTLCAEMDNYTETLSVITRAADVTGDPLGLLGQVGDLLDRWAARCERIRQRENVDELDAFVEWTVLLTQAGEVLSVCQHADTSGTLPGECRQDSAQFLAYKLGQLAARFASDNAHLWQDFMEESDQPGGVDFLVEALLCDLEARPDWHKLRDRYETGWRRTVVYDRASVEEISPAIDLYWAMRIGFADKLLETTQALVAAEPPAASPDRMQIIQDMLTGIGLRQLKQQREEDERLPPTEDAIEQCLRERLGDLWDNLPSDVADVLMHAEYSYEARMQSGTTTRQVVMGFHDAVWACFQAYFLDRFIAFLEKEKWQSTRLSYRGWQDRWEEREFKPDNPTSLSIRGWASVLQVVADPEHKGTENLQVKEFVKRSWPTLGRDVLKELAGSLHEVQDYRNPAVHRQWPPRSHHEERADLEAMRKLVLGTEGGASSLIVQIYRLLAPGKQP